MWRDSLTTIHSSHRSTDCSCSSIRSTCSRIRHSGSWKGLMHALWEEICSVIVTLSDAGSLGEEEEGVLTISHRLLLWPEAIHTKVTHSHKSVHCKIWVIAAEAADVGACVCSVWVKVPASADVSTVSFAGVSVWSCDAVSLKGCGCLYQSVHFWIIPALQSPDRGFTLGPPSILELKRPNLGSVGVPSSSWGRFCEHRQELILDQQQCFEYKPRSLLSTLCCSLYEHIYSTLM